MPTPRNTISMKDFGRKTSGNSYKNPKAIWQDIFVLDQQNNNDHFWQREDVQDYYTISVACENCSMQAMLGILKGYIRPDKYMCWNCKTMQPPKLGVNMVQPVYPQPPF